MSKLCEGRVAIVTGAGQGLGRSHALALAQAGASVIVNDIGDAAQDVVREIHNAGGEAIATEGDVANWEYAASLIALATQTYGDLHAVINNAGIVRDRMLVSMAEVEWDDVLRVDLKGHFCPLRHAAAYWRERSKAGQVVDARVVNTSSGAGLMGSIGQVNYAAAKAGVAAMTLVAAAELARYRVTVNAIAPAARTSMTASVFAEAMRAPDSGFDAMDPDNVSPLIVWLASAKSREVTGRVFEIQGGVVGVADGWQSGPRADKGDRWDPSELGPVVRKLLAKAPPPAPVFGA